VSAVVCLDPACQRLTVSLVSVRPTHRVRAAAARAPTAL
jgi:hypothetical protein